MAPHFRGESHSFAGAFEECSLALHDLGSTPLDDEIAQGWVDTIRSTMDTTGIDAPEHLGTKMVKISCLSQEEKAEFSSAVDELASFLAQEIWSGR